MWLCKYTLIFDINLYLYFTYFHTEKCKKNIYIVRFTNFPFFHFTCTLYIKQHCISRWMMLRSCLVNLNFGFMCLSALHNELLSHTPPPTHTHTHTSALNACLSMNLWNLANLNSIEIWNETNQQPLVRPGQFCSVVLGMAAEPRLVGLQPELTRDVHVCVLFWAPVDRIPLVMQ